LSVFACARCELGVLGLAFCTIAAVVTLVRSRQALELRIATAHAQWEDAFSRFGERLASCEARLAGTLTGASDRPREIDDQEIASCLESLRDLVDSLRMAKEGQDRA